MRRFVAEWVARQAEEDASDCDYEGAEYSSLAVAKREAVKRSKRANAVEWVRVAEEERTRYGWDSLQVWVGDWQGNWQRVSE